MSAPHQFAIESQNIGYGLLASSLANTLRTRPQGELDDVAAICFSQGAEFLDDMVRGAEIVSLGKCSSLTTEKSIEALGYAMEPITALRDVVVSNEDIVRILKEIASFLNNTAKERSLSFKDASDELQRDRARVFFEILAQRILSSLSSARMREAPDAIW